MAMSPAFITERQDAAGGRLRQVHSPDQGGLSTLELSMYIPAGADKGRYPMTSDDLLRANITGVGVRVNPEIVLSPHLVGQREVTYQSQSLKELMRVKSGFFYLPNRLIERGRT